MTNGKSDSHRAFAEDGAVKTHIGGQALIEGVMMRGKFNWAVAVREPDGGVYLEEHDLSSGKAKNGWMYWPFVRGCRALVESLMLGFKALEIAAMHAFDDEEDEAGEGKGISSEGPDDASLSGKSEEKPSVSAVVEQEGHPASGKPAPAEDLAPADERVPADSAKDDEGDFGHREMVISMVAGLILGVVLFVVAPAFVTNLIVGEYDENTLLWNVVDGILRVAVFIFYIWIIGRMEEIKRMFSYHGAEHKTIHCYEHQMPLTPENARSFPRLHVRCGTAFLIMVMLIAIFVYTIVPLNALILAWGVPDGAPKLALVILIRILLMPVIAGISYEITVKWAGNNPDNPLVKVILWPGMQMQRLTTNEPDDGMLECAIAAMQAVIDREEAEARAAQTPCAEAPNKKENSL